MAFGKVLRSSDRHDWRTPRPLFDHFAGIVGGFDLDVAADAGSALCAAWFGPGSPLAEDALAVSWYEAARVALGRRRGARIVGWLNPPYGDSLLPFLRAAVRNVAEAPELEVSVLVPARVDTHWYSVAVSKAIAAYMLRGRVRFEGTMYKPAPHAWAGLECSACRASWPAVPVGLEGFALLEALRTIESSIPACTAPPLEIPIGSAPFPSAVLRLQASGRGNPSIHWGYEWKPRKARREVA